MILYKDRESYSKVRGRLNLDICCAKHNKHAKHDPARDMPQENFES